MALIWCILTNSFLGICFKLFPKWDIKALHAIVINYSVCFLMGLFISLKKGEADLRHLTEMPWFKFDIVLGLLFISGFNLAYYTITHFGIGQSIIMQKMSILLTVAFAVLFFDEPFGWALIAGLGLSVLSIIAINYSNKKHEKINIGKAIFMLSLVLLFSAAIEIVLLYVQKTDMVKDQQLMFTTIGFGIAAICGWVGVLYLYFVKKIKPAGKDLIAGVILGIPNFFSVYLILKLLEKGWEGSILYPILNVSILLITAIAAIFFFKETLNKINKWGIAFAVMAIIVLALAENDLI